MSAACAARAEARFGQSRPAASLFKRSDGGMDAGVSGGGNTVLGDALEPLMLDL
jgi:hypothetical protein